MADTMTTPPVPLTVEGSAVLHQMLRVRWAEWRKTPEVDRAEMTAQASSLLGGMESGGTAASAAFSLLGHKGDLMLVHFRAGFPELEELQLRLRSLRLFDYLEQ